MWVNSASGTIRSSTACTILFCTNVSWDTTYGWYGPVAMHSHELCSISITCKDFILSRTAGIASNSYFKCSHSILTTGDNNTFNDRKTRMWNSETLQPCYVWCPRGTSFHTSPILARECVCRVKSSRMWAAKPARQRRLSVTGNWLRATLTQPSMFKHSLVILVPLISCLKQATHTCFEKLLCDWNDWKDFRNVTIKTCVGSMFHTFLSILSTPCFLNERLSSFDSASFERLFRLVLSVSSRKNKLNCTRSSCKEDYLSEISTIEF